MDTVFAAVSYAQLMFMSLARMLKHDVLAAWSGDSEARDRFYRVVLAILFAPLAGALWGRAIHFGFGLDGEPRFGMAIAAIGLSSLPLYWGLLTWVFLVNSSTDEAVDAAAGLAACSIVMFIAAMLFAF